MTSKTGTLKQMLFLTRSIFGADLLAVDTLYGETLYVFYSVSIDVVLLYYQDTGSRALSSSLARNSTNAACTS